MHWINFLSPSLPSVLTSAPKARNSSARSENAMISVGQTNVLQATSRKQFNSWSPRFGQPFGYFYFYLQIGWVEEEDQVLPLEVRQLDFLEFSVNHGLSAEVRCRLSRLQHSKMTKQKRRRKKLNADLNQRMKMRLTSRD